MIPKYRNLGRTLSKFEMKDVSGGIASGGYACIATCPGGQIIACSGETGCFAKDGPRGVCISDDTYLTCPPNHY